MTDENLCGEETSIYREKVHGTLCRSGSRSATPVSLNEDDVCIPMVTANNQRVGGLTLMQTLTVERAGYIVQIDQ